MTWPTTWLLLGAYILLGRWLVRWRGRAQAMLFALLNIAVVWGFFFCGWKVYAAGFVLYLAMVSFQYFCLRRWEAGSGWLPFLAPIFFLIFIRYTPFALFPWLTGFVSSPASQMLRNHPQINPAVWFVGLSYLAFRTSHLALEVRNGVVPRPNYWEYIGFAFFAPTFSVGPINPYSQHRLAFAGERPPEIPEGRALLRILVGGVKYTFFSPLLNELTYSGLLRDGHPHPWVDLPIAMVAYYLYLYCNFSGFCDIAIGGAGLMGVPVAENFANPLAARNMREFWNRWHITLSQWMRDIVFSPLSKALVRLFGPAQVNQAIAVAIFVVFLLIGVWHGVGWNYAAFGVAQALGVIVTHYYTIGLKKRLNRDGFKAYNSNPWIHAAATGFTFCYYAATLFLFANTFPQMKDIFATLH